MSMMNKLGGMLKDSALDFDQIRSLNDQMNTVVKDLGRWERRIGQLGGADYKTASMLNKQTFNSGGGNVVNSGRHLVAKGPDGYLYFGRAKEMPGIKELLQMSVVPADSENQDEQDGDNISQQSLKSLIEDKEYMALRPEDLEEDRMICDMELARESETALQMIPTDAEVDNVLKRSPSLQELEQYLLQIRKERLLNSMDIK